MASSRRFGRPSVVARYTSLSTCVILSFLLVENSHLEQIDSIDPAFAPATGTPETGGTSFFFLPLAPRQDRIVVSYPLI